MVVDGHPRPLVVARKLIEETRGEPLGDRVRRGGPDGVDGVGGATLTLPQPPGWIAELPVIGTRLVARWQRLAAAGPEEISAPVSAFARGVVLWFVGQVGSLGLLLIHFLLTVVVVAILYANGETASRGVERFARRLAADGVLRCARRRARQRRGLAVVMRGGQRKNRANQVHRFGIQREIFVGSWLLALVLPPS